MEINIPGDRKCTFEPQIIKKYQNTVTQDVSGKSILCIPKE